MITAVRYGNIPEYNSYKRIQYKNPQKQNTTQPQQSQNILKGLAAAAILGIAATGLYAYKKQINIKNIRNIKYMGQTLANEAVYSSGTRNKNALDLYKQGIADKKAAVLRYKLNNGFFIGKSLKEKHYIRNNLKNLEQLSI